MTKENLSDQNEIDQIVARFFNLFTNKGNQIPKVEDLKNIFIAQGVIINNTEDPPAIFDLDSFIKPRQEMLSVGMLTDFIEYEVSQKTAIYGNMAQRVSQYAKSGILNGSPFEGSGNKIMQFIKANGQWLFVSVIWADTV